MGGCYQRQREEKNGWTPLRANILLLPLHFLQAPGLQCYLAQAIGFLELLDSSNVFKVPSLAVGENRDRTHRSKAVRNLLCRSPSRVCKQAVSRIPALRGLYWHHFLLRQKWRLLAYKRLKIAWHTEQDNGHSTKQWDGAARAERFKAAFLLSRMEESSRASTL